MSDAPYKNAPAVAIPVAVGGDQTHDVNGIRVGAWGAEICGCFTDCVPNCLMATCLPCVSLAQIAHRMNVARYSYVLITFLVLVLIQITFSSIASITAMNNANDRLATTGSYHWTSSGYHTSYDLSPETQASYQIYNIASSIASLLYIVLIWQLRTKIRERFQIPGSCCEDYCCVWWCSCCAIAQMATHTKSYKPSSCDFGPPDMLPAFE